MTDDAIRAATGSFDEYLARSLAAPPDAARFLRLALAEFARDGDDAALAVAVRAAERALAAAGESVA